MIAVTACDDNPFASRLLQAGASGYITKGADAEEMYTAIVRVKTGQKYISPEIAQRMALKPFQQDQASPFDELSEREMQIALMIVGCQKVQEISEKLFLSPKTVNSYRYRIFDKLDIESDVQLTLMAMRHGLVDPGGSGSGRLRLMAEFDIAAFLQTLSQRAGCIVCTPLTMSCCMLVKPKIYATGFPVIFAPAG